MIYTIFYMYDFVLNINLLILKSVSIQNIYIMFIGV